MRQAILDIYSVLHCLLVPLPRPPPNIADDSSDWHTAELSPVLNIAFRHTEAAIRLTVKKCTRETPTRVAPLVAVNVSAWASLAKSVKGNTHKKIPGVRAGIGF